jgi:SAM-dependent methyltransferase
MRRSIMCPSCESDGELAAYAVVAHWACELMGHEAPQPTELLDCPRCGLSFYSQRYDEADMAGLYSQYRTESYLRTRQRWEPWYRASINNAFEPSSPATAQRVQFLEAALRSACGDRVWSVIVDVGGDAGQFFPRRVTGRRVLIDPSNKQLPDGVERVSSLGELGSAPDLIILAHVLEHLTDPLVLLSELHEVLVDDGRLYVEVPTDRPATTGRDAATRHGQRLDFLARHRVPFVAADFASGVGRRVGIRGPFSVIKQSEHLNFFSEGSLSAMLSRVGFDVEYSVADPRANPAGMTTGLLGVVARKVGT